MTDQHGCMIFELGELKVVTFLSTIFLCKEGPRSFLNVPSHQPKTKFKWPNTSSTCSSVGPKKSKRREGKQAAKKLKKPKQRSPISGTQKSLAVCLCTCLRCLVCPKKYCASRLSVSKHDQLGLKLGDTWAYHIMVKQKIHREAPQWVSMMNHWLNLVAGAGSNVHLLGALG